MRLHRVLTIASVGLSLAFGTLLSGLTGSQALAQGPAPAAAPDPAFEAARAAFDALPEADRRAIQDALVWTGDYKGTVDGGFGRMTREAIIAFAKRAKLPADGSLDTKARAALVAAGAKARDAALFKPVLEAKSGVTIGVPAKLFSKKTASAQGARYNTPDGAAALDVFSAPDPGNELSAMYDRLKVDAPNRKVSYKVLRADFFVVSGDAAGRVFYTRVARGVAEGAPVLRGYTLTYPVQQRAAFDALNIAIANSFSPFATAAVAVANAPAGAGGAARPPQTPGLAPPLQASAPRPTLVGSAIVVAPGKALAVMASRTCTDAQIGGRKATMSPQPGPDGLVMFDVPGQTAPALALATGSASGPVVVLQQGPRAGVPASELIVAPGDLGAGETGARVFAPLQRASNGAAVFSRSGALVGLVGVAKSAPRLVAGIVPAAASPVIGTDPAKAFLQSAGVVSAPSEAGKGEKSAGEIAAASGASVLPLFCTQ